jgi:dTMP kinase
MQKRGILITVEGGEGVGKTTQIRLLKERLIKEFPKRAFVFTKEPGGTPFADQIRELILGEGGKEAGAKTMFALFMASRFEHVERVVQPALRAGKVVVCDRYAAATYAYQIVAQGGNELLPMYKEQLKLLKLATPDLTLIFDMDPKKALVRLATRTGQPITHFDTRKLDFHVRLRKGYKAYAKKFAPRQSRFINAEGSIEAIHEAVWKEVRKAVLSHP